ncbi:MAG: hypothetical protein ACTSUE_05895 [Promethearchaeota archaeon]
MSEKPDEKDILEEEVDDPKEPFAEETGNQVADGIEGDEMEEGTNHTGGEDANIDDGNANPDAEAMPGSIEEVIHDGEEDESIFDSEGDLEEIFSAMSDVKKDEEKILKSALEAIESGEAVMEEQLGNMSAELAEKIQSELKAREAEDEENFVTEEEFINQHKDDLEKIWYHCLFFLAFKSEDGKATKHGLYESLKDVVSKSPIDPLPEHMFNFGLSSLIKIQLYEKPIVSFDSSGFSLQIDKKMLQDLLLKIGRPLSRRPVITQEEEKKMFQDFLDL